MGAIAWSRGWLRQCTGWCSLRRDVPLEVRRQGISGDADLGVEPLRNLLTYRPLFAGGICPSCDEKLPPTARS